ncbi:MAG: hypothetical protein H0T69_14720 [Thermoleophilaceae bacterium]|nr:hypothetical protein [Thermoleophilaceae bacterium]
MIGTKVGSSDTATRPLWVRMRGGGVGFFDAAGNPQPSAQNKSEESAATSIGFLNDVGLVKLVRADPAAFRLVSVSMCNHDIYAGGDMPDPNNPNTLPDGSGRTTNGLFATKAAVQFAQELYPTSKTFLHGTSAGSAGALAVSWGLEEQGIPPAGAIADSGVVNIEWEQAQNEQGVCPGGGRGPEALEAIKARSQYQLADIKNEPDKLVSRGELAVPLLHTWSRADPNVCGATPMSCPLRNGTTKTLGAADCVHEPLRAAIAGLGAGSKSRNVRVCVSPAGNPGSCATHVVTTQNATNTDPAEPADYNASIMSWVRARLGDP